MLRLPAGRSDVLPNRRSDAWPPVQADSSWLAVCLRVPSRLARRGPKRLNSRPSFGLSPGQRFVIGRPQRQSQSVAPPSRRSRLLTPGRFRSAPGARWVPEPGHVWVETTIAPPPVRAVLGEWEMGSAGGSPGLGQLVPTPRSAPARRRADKATAVVNEQAETLPAGGCRSRVQPFD
jgi:hypothetical protein